MQQHGRMRRGEQALRCGTVWFTPSSGNSCTQGGTKASDCHTSSHGSRVNLLSELPPSSFCSLLHRHGARLYWRTCVSGKCSSLSWRDDSQSSLSATCKHVVSGSEAQASRNGQELNTPLLRQQKEQAVRYRAKNNCKALSLPPSCSRRMLEVLMAESIAGTAPTGRCIKALVTF